MALSGEKVRRAAAISVFNVRVLIIMRDLAGRGYTVRGQHAKRTVVCDVWVIIVMQELACRKW